MGRRLPGALRVNGETKFVTTPMNGNDPWSRMHHPEEIDLPPHRTKDLDRRPWWHAASLERTPNIQEDFRLLRETRSRVPDQTDVQLRQMISNYYGMISLIDHSVGRIVDYVSRITPGAQYNNYLY